MTPKPAGVAERLAFDLTDRLAKSLKVSGMKVEDLAKEMAVSRATIANWTSGRTAIRRNDLRAWAQITEVPFEWLETGKIPPSGDDPDGGNVVEMESFLSESNRRPFHYNDDTLLWDPNAHCLIEFPLLMTAAA